jgi:hypothetical protein
MDRGGMKRVKTTWIQGSQGLVMGPGPLTTGPMNQQRHKNFGGIFRLRAPRDERKCSEKGGFWGSTCQHYMPILIPNRGFGLSQHFYAVRALEFLCISNETGGL